MLEAVWPGLVSVGRSASTPSASRGNEPQRRRHTDLRQDRLGTRTLSESADRAAARRLKRAACVSTLRYGHYREEELMALSQRSRAMNRHETQGSQPSRYLRRTCRYSPGTKAASQTAIPSAGEVRAGHIGTLLGRSMRREVQDRHRDCPGLRHILARCGGRRVLPATDDRGEPHPGKMCVEIRLAGAAFRFGWQDGGHRVKFRIDRPSARCGRSREGRCRGHCVLAQNGTAVRGQGFK